MGIMNSDDSSIKELKDLLRLPSVCQMATVEAQIEGAISNIENYKDIIEQLRAELDAAIKEIGVWSRKTGHLQAELEQLRWIPVSERLPTLNDRDEYSRQQDDGTINVFGCDDGITFVTNYFPKMDVWNGLIPVHWKPIILP